MGWDFAQISKKELIADLLKSKPLDYELQNFSKTESVLWVLIDTKEKKYGKRVICYLIERRKIEGKYWWGYKDIDDMMGPCAVSCPLRLIEASTKIKHDYVKMWHDQVRAFWKKLDEIGSAA